LPTVREISTIKVTMRTDARLRPPWRFLTCALPLALLAPGCGLFGIADAKVSFFSEPPGARVIVDKRDTGFVTPCHLSLSTDRHRIELEMPGYQTAGVTVVSKSTADVVYWSDMTIRAGMWRFPLWLNLEDTVEPIKYDVILHPARIYVRLQRAPGP